MTKAEHFLEEAQKILEEADLINQAKVINDNFKTLFAGKSMAGLLPEPNRLEGTDASKYAREYVKAARPLLLLMEQVNDHVRALRY